MSSHEVSWANRATAAVGIGVLTLSSYGCSQKAPTALTECVATTGVTIGGNHLRDYGPPAPGKEGVLAKIAMQYGVSRDVYYGNFGGRVEVADQIEADLNASAAKQKKSHSQLGSNDIIMLCITLDDQDNPNKGGHFRPYVTPTAGKLATTAVFNTSKTPTWFKKAENTAPKAKFFVVSDDQTKLLPKL